MMENYKEKIDSLIYEVKLLSECKGLSSTIVKSLTSINSRLKDSLAIKLDKKSQEKIITYYRDKLNRIKNSLVKL